jgi:hypothetical protein
MAGIVPPKQLVRHFTKLHVEYIVKNRSHIGWLLERKLGSVKFGPRLFSAPIGYKWGSEL